MTIAPITTEMRPLSLRFVDAALEAEFAEEQARKSVRLFRLACALGAVLILSFAVVVYFFPQIPGHVVYVGPWIGVVLACCALGYAESYRRGFLRRQQRIVLIGLCLESAALTSLTLVLPPSQLGGLLALVVMHLLPIYSEPRRRFPRAGFAGWLTGVLLIACLAGTGAAWA